LGSKGEWFDWEGGGGCTLVETIGGELISFWDGVRDELLINAMALNSFDVIPLIELKYKMNETLR
jgi:hypothetical protein